MEVTIIFKIAAVGILVSILSQVLKHSGRDEQAFMVSLAGLLIVLFWIVPYIYELFQNISAGNLRCSAWLFFERNKNGICFVHNDGDRYHNSGTGCG